MGGHSATEEEVRYIKPGVQSFPEPRAAPRNQILRMLLEVIMVSMNFPFKFGLNSGTDVLFTDASQPLKEHFS